MDYSSDSSDMLSDAGLLAADEDKRLGSRHFFQALYFRWYDRESPPQYIRENYERFLQYFRELDAISDEIHGSGDGLVTDYEGYLMNSVINFAEEAGAGKIHLLFFWKALLELMLLPETLDPELSGLDKNELLKCRISVAGLIDNSEKITAASQHPSDLAFERELMSSFTMWVSPGSATPEQVIELFEAASALNRSFGGAALAFRRDEGKQPISLCFQP